MKVGPRLFAPETSQLATLIVFVGVARRVVSQFSIAVSVPTSTHTMVFRRSSLLMFVSAASAAGISPDRAVPSRSRVASDVSAPSSAGIAPVMPLLPPRSSCVRLVIEPMPAGIVPVSWLSPRTRMRRLASEVSCVQGMSPVSWLCCRPRPVSAVSMPSSVGMVPVSWLLLRPRTVSAVSEPSSVGISPDSALRPRSRLVSAVSEPMLAGISPVSPLAARSRLVSPVSVPMPAGMVPVSPAFSPRSRLVSWFSSTSEAGSAPTRLLFDRSSAVTRPLPTVTPCREASGPGVPISRLGLASVASKEPVKSLVARAGLICDDVQRKTRPPAPSANVVSVALSTFRMVPSMMRVRPLRWDLVPCGLITSSMAPPVLARVTPARVYVVPDSVNVAVPLRIDPCAPVPLR